MRCGDCPYLWQAEHWPDLRYDLTVLAGPLAAVSRHQGMLMGRLADVGMGLRDQASLASLTEEVVRTSAIEGEHLDVASVRSSIGRRLGVDVGAAAPRDAQVEGVVAMMLDATLNCEAPITRERLFGWHAALFPSGYSGLHRIRVGGWREDADGPMRVVSGPVGRQRVHFEAPPAARLEGEMARFLAWANRPLDAAPLLKAGLGHLWFVTVHPFEDGNGRIARAISELLLARADGCPQRFYSLSGQFQRERKAYYDLLERTQQSGVDVTAWLSWWLATLQRALEQAHRDLDSVLARSNFWQRFAHVARNDRQAKVLNRLLDGFEGKLTTAKWAAMAKCSPDTALRDITELLSHGLLRKAPGGGRSTSYELDLPPHG